MGLLEIFKIASRHGHQLDNSKYPAIKLHGGDLRQNVTKSGEKILKNFFQQIDWSLCLFERYM